MKILLIGTDPEILIQRKGKILNAIPFIPTATKDSPLPMEKEGFSFMFDRATIEWNQPPTNNLGDFKENIKYAMGYIKSLLPEDIDFSNQASAFLDTDEIEKDDRCIEVGCSASYSCYTGEENKKPDVEKYPNLQCCGFHFHLQFDKLTIPQAMQVGRVLDIFLGVPSIVMDGDLYRRMLYGKAGEMRFNFPENRLEYRVLSNFILFNERYQDWAWNNIHRAIEYLNEHENVDHMENQVRTCIDHENIALAQSLCEEFQLLPEQQKVEV